MIKQKFKRFDGWLESDTLAILVALKCHRAKGGVYINRNIVCHIPTPDLIYPQAFLDLPFVLH